MAEERDRSIGFRPKRLSASSDDQSSCTADEDATVLQCDQESLQVMAAGIALHTAHTRVEGRSSDRPTTRTLRFAESTIFASESFSFPTGNDLCGKCTKIKALSRYACHTLLSNLRKVRLKSSALPKRTANR